LNAPVTDSIEEGQPHHAKPLLRSSGIGKTYRSAGGEVVAVRDLSFDVSSGEFVSIVGPSGCGKTTLLTCVSGLLTPTSGTSYLRGVPIDGPPEGLSIVFQDYSRSLFPWLSVARNIALPLVGQRGLNKQEIRGRMEELLIQVGLDPSVRSRYPWQLSGGMQQRVAIARSLISDPDLLIMDEPFASVDAQTRIVLEDLLLEVRSRLNKTILFVTHDIDEAVYLSDRIVVLSKSPATVLTEIDVPLQRPRNQIETKKDARFAALRAEVLGLVITGQRPEQ
jgi:NitT/TauT family transport system ATP-binding protein